MAEEDQDQYRFAHRDMLFEGLTWLKENANWITLNISVPDSGGSARDTMIAGTIINGDDFMGPEYVDPEAAEEHPLKKGDVILYLNGALMLGLYEGTAVCACLLKEAALLYMAPATGIDIIPEQPVFLGPWCISSPQPTRDCELPQ